MKRIALHLPAFTVLVIATLVALMLVISVLPYANVLWDEAVFLTRINAASTALTALRLGEWFSVPWRLTQYPPVQAWLDSILLVPFGFTVTATRTTQLIFFVMSAFTLWGIAQQFGRVFFKNARISSWAAGGMSVIFFLTCPLILYLSSVALKESISILFSLLTVYWYIDARTHLSRSKFTVAGIWLMLLFMTKLPYGIFMTLGLGLETIITLLTREESWKKVMAKHAMLFLPLGAVAIVWLLLPVNRVAEFLTFMANDTINYTNRSNDPWNIILFYPRGIVYLFAATPLIGMTIIAASLLAIRWFRRWQVRSLWLVVAANILPLAIHPQNLQERYISITVPLLFVLSAGIMTDMARTLSKTLRFPPLLRACLLGAGIFYIAFQIPFLPMKIFAVGNIAMKGVAFSQPDFRDSWFNYDTSTWPKIHPKYSRQVPMDVARYLASRIDLTRPIRITGYANEFSPDFFTLAFDVAKKRGETITSPHSSYLVTIEISPQSPYYTYDYQIVNAWQQGEIAWAKTQGEAQKIDEEHFPALGVTVTIYARP